MHRLVALTACATHVCFVAFMVVGGVLAWFAPWVLLPHLASAAWGAWMVGLRNRCPLSVAENWGRRGSGRPELHERGWLAHYVEGHVYPIAWARRVEIVAGTLVFGSWIGLAVR